MENENLNEMQKASEENLEFVTGGTGEQESFKKTFGSKMCDCGKFEPSVNACNLNICDNCKWSKKEIDNNGEKIYCTMQ